MKIGVILVFVFLLVLSSSAYAGWFGPDPPPPGPVNGGNASTSVGIGPYLYSVATSMYFNESYLNDTIDKRAGGLGVFLPLAGGQMYGDIDMGGQSITNATLINATYGVFHTINVSNNSVYIGGTKLSGGADTLVINDGFGNVTAQYYTGSGLYLTDINSTNISIYSTNSSFAENATYAEDANTANTANFATSTIDYWVNASGDQMSGDLGMGNNSIYGVDQLYTNVTWAHAYGGLSPIHFVADDGQTLVNFSFDGASTSGVFGTIRAHRIVVDDITVGDFLNWTNASHPSQFQGWNITGSKYMINSSYLGTPDILDINETILNQTIIQIVQSTSVNISGGKPKGGDGQYLYNDTNIMYFNESKLNYTIDYKIQSANWTVNGTDINVTKVITPVVVTNRIEDPGSKSYTEYWLGNMVMHFEP